VCSSDLESLSFKLLEHSCQADLYVVFVGSLRHNVTYNGIYAPEGLHFVFPKLDSGVQVIAEHCPLQSFFVIPQALAVDGAEGPFAVISFHSCVFSYTKGNDPWFRKDRWPSRPSFMACVKCVFVKHAYFMLGEKHGSNGLLAHFILLAVRHAVSSRSGTFTTST